MDPSAPSLRSRIVDAECLMEELITDEASARREMQIIQSEIGRIHQERYNPYLNPHQMLLTWMEDLRIEIGCIDKFPNLPTHYYDRPSTTNSKEFVELVRKLETRLHHNKSKSLVTKRKTIQQLRRLEGERENERLNHDDNEASTQFKKPEMASLKTIHSKKKLESIIREWAEKIQFVANEMFRDSQTSVVRWETYDEFEKLWRFVRTSIRKELDGVDEAMLKRCWNSMKDKGELIERIRIDAMKAWKRHMEGYAQFRKLHQQCLRTCKLNLARAGQEWRDLRSQRAATRKLLFELRKERNELSNVSI